MSALARIAAFGVLLAVVFAAAALAGSTIDPEVETDAHMQEGSDTMEQHETSAGGTAEHGSTHGGEAAAATLPGLAVSQGGYRLIPERTTLPSDRGARFGFTVVEENGRTVQDFDTEHARRMHLIVVRRDFANFQHVHPTQLEDGSWQADLDLEPAGVYRAFADFSTAGESLTLASDLFVAGSFRPEPLAPVAETATAGQGYEVSLKSGRPQGGTSTPVRFTVTRNGRELSAVEPYLGADGHLVALREHDQAFLHTHPEGRPGGSGPISFQVEYPTAGRYRLFLQFKDRGRVRTAAFTQEVLDGTAAAGGTTDGSHDEGAH